MDTDQATNETETLSQDAVDELFKQSKQTTESHRCERHPYRTLQLFAPHYDEKIPSQKSVQPAMCVDLSAAGVAFMWPSRPTFESGIIRLGQPPTFTNLVVNVRDVRQVGDEYLVDCQFVEKVS